MENPSLIVQGQDQPCRGDKCGAADKQRFEIRAAWIKAMRPVEI